MINDSYRPEGNISIKLSTIIYNLSFINYHLSFKIMARTVTYTVVPKINPRDRETEPKFYGNVKSSGDINIREMAERIQGSCTVTKADVYAVLVALEDVIAESIQKGEIVRLMDIGTFRVGISTKGALKEEDFNDALIKKTRILFRPGSVLQNAIANLNFTKVKRVIEPEEDESEESPDEAGED